jgi:NhaP-type Na+/H+ or K+/H+ antiporter
MSTNQVLTGVALIVALAVSAQVLAHLLRIPALILLLPFGFLAGAFTDVVHANKLFGPAAIPMVDLAVALILYDAGLGLDLRKLTGHTRTVVVRLIVIGIPVTGAIAAWMAALLLGMSQTAAVMVGTILVVSGPTVVGPLLELVRPVERPQRILVWEGSIIDPLGAILGAVVFNAIVAGTKFGSGRRTVEFVLSMGVGLLGGAAGVALLWVLLRWMRLPEVLTTAAQIAVVIGVAVACDIVRDEAGLIAAVVIGLAVGNLRGFNLSARRPFFEVLVNLILGLLFVTVSASIMPDSLKHVVLPTLGLVAVLVILVRPLVAAFSTWRTELDRGERAFIGWMAPRGIVAAATASTFAAALARKGISGADRILPVTFLVIVCTVTLYGLSAGTVARVVGVSRPARSRPLMVGGEQWVIDLARALRAAGLDVLMWSGQPDERERARAADFELAAPDVVALATGRGNPMEGVTVVLLLTGEDDFNALASSLLQGNVDDGVYRSAAPSQAHGVVAPYFDSGVLFAPGLTHAEIRARCAKGARIDVQPAAAGDTSEHDVLFVISREGALRPVTALKPPTPGPEDTLVVLAG